MTGTDWIEAVHSIVVPVTNKSNGSVGMVLMWGYPNIPGSFQTVPKLWDPSTNSFYTSVPIPTTALPSDGTPFCAGHSFFADGTVLVTGGDQVTQTTNGYTVTNYGNLYNIWFNPFEKDLTVPPNGWHPAANLNDPACPSPTCTPAVLGGRWYPTNVPVKTPNMTQEHVFTFSGRNRDKTAKPPITNNTVEHYKTDIDIWTVESTNIPIDVNTINYYPRLHLLAPGDTSTYKGKIFYSGMEPNGRLYDPATSTWLPASSAMNSINRRDYGTSVLLPSAGGTNGKILIVGGQDLSQVITYPCLDDTACAIFNTAKIIDFSQVSPTWASAGTMSVARVQLNAVILPDGKVLGVGGEHAPCIAASGQGNEFACTALYTADLYSPDTGSWLSPSIPAPPTTQQRPRQYHSTAVLLPDGRVLLAGGDTDSDPTLYQYPSGQIYRPGYLFRGPRPTITSYPGVINYGTNFTLNVTTPGGQAVTKVLLIRPGAVTHAFNNEQRSIQLTFTQSGSQLTVTPPPNTDQGQYLAPGGYYLLFVVIGNGDSQVPSEAKFVQLALPASPGGVSGARTTRIR